MHIGIDARPLLTRYKTGIGEFTYSLLESLLQLPSEHHFYMFTTGTEPLPWPTNNYTVVRSPLPSKLLNSATTAFGRPHLDEIICRQTKLSRLDAFFSPHLNFTALTSATPHFLTIHDLNFSLFPEYFTAKQQWWHRLLNPKKQCTAARTIFTPSENTRRDVITAYGIAPEKVHCLYPGLRPAVTAITAEQLRKKYTLPERFIVFLGTREPRKNIALLVQAFTAATQKIAPSIGLVIVGAPGWKNDATTKQTAASPAANRIISIPFVTDSEKIALYQAAECCVYPSIYEGFGFPLLEAMQAGTPVITTNHSSLPEIGGTAAYYINPNRPDELIAALSRLTTNQALRADKIKKGREQAAQFQWDKTAAALLRALTC